MKKEYMKPEVEMMKFVEEEDLMIGDVISGGFGTQGSYEGGTTDYTFPY